MKFRMTASQSRFAAVGLLILVAALLAAAVALPTWWLHRHYDNHLEDYSDRLARYRRVAAMRPAIEEAIATLEKRDAHKYYLKGASPTLTAAELQGYVARVIESRKGRIISTQVLPAKDEGKTTGPTKVVLSVQMNTAIVPLQLVLHALETGEPYLFIDQLVVRASQGRGYKPVPGVQPEFNVQMTIHGYALPAGGKP